MSKNLSDIIKSYIQKNSFIDIGKFMELCLGHPEYGYYITRDPLGKNGDFITAPEISQMFGEMIGICLADYWLKNYYRQKISLVELGAGRGTLMSDMLRATKDIPYFHDNLSIELVEISPFLQEIQRKKLSSFSNITWHDKIDDLDNEKPVFIIANEFFDALPVRQAIYIDNLWRERIISLNKDNQLVFGYGKVLTNNFPVQGKKGDIFEFSPVRQLVMKDLSCRIKKQGGLALIIDYGHIKSAIGDSLQGVKNHSYIDVLVNLGEVDITSHIDFESLQSGIKGLSVLLEEQGRFLKELGIEIRAGVLNNKNSNEEMHRLVSNEEMGALFKVMVVIPENNIKPEGFSTC